MPKQSNQSNYDTDLFQFFTDVEDLRRIFSHTVEAPSLQKPMLVIHGVGGVGKSSLLRMLRFYCKQKGIPVGLASGDEAKSAIETLAQWSMNLKDAGIKLKTFSKNYEQYQAIQAKVEEQTRKAIDLREKAVNSVGKATAKTLVEMMASTIPVVGPIASAVGGMGAEAFVDWLHGFLSKPEIDLLLDPTKKLSTNFLEDIEKASAKQRFVLMLDAFEQLSSLEDWVCNLAKELSPNILLVLAGRAVPEWDRKWPGWLARANVQELKPMTDDVMRELIRRYYEHICGGIPDPAQVNVIIQFARGLPVAVNSAVRLWVEYCVADFQVIKKEVVADLVDRLMEGVSPEIVPVLEAAAVLRWFNLELLQVITGSDNLAAVFGELRDFPFVRPKLEGYALHDTVRKFLEENLRDQTPQKYRLYHQRAADYFRSLIETTYGFDAEKISLEIIYHEVSADEANGLLLYIELADRYVRNRLVNQLKYLQNDAESYPFRLESSLLWLKFFKTRLIHFDSRLSEAEEAYSEISHHPSAEKKLKAYAFCELGDILVRPRWLHKPEGVGKAIRTLESAHELLAKSDEKRIIAISKLLSICLQHSESDRFTRYESEAHEILAITRSIYEKVLLLDSLRITYGLRGDWAKLLEIQRQLDLLKPYGNSKYLSIKAESTFSIAWIWLGRYHEAEEKAWSALNGRKDIGDPDVTHPLKEVGFTAGMQGKYEEAAAFFKESIDLSHRIDEVPREAVVYGYSGRILIRKGDLEQAREHLRKCIEGSEMLTDNRIVEVKTWLAEIDEIQGQFTKAEASYHKVINSTLNWRLYYKCASLIGLARVQFAQSHFQLIPALFTEAEEIAQQYEYNDHLTSLRMLQAQAVWEKHVPAWGNGFKKALFFYQQSLVYALRYNRFLVDEILWGGGFRTPLKPILSYCQTRGDAGRKMLTALRDWWKIGINDIGFSRPNSISPIPEGIPLLLGERLARQREPGDGHLQKNVIQILEEALAE